MGKIKTAAKDKKISSAPSTKPFAALYVRVSTDAQAEEGYSIDEQQKRLIAQCAVLGISDYQLYIDGGWSGSTLDRPEMQHLIQDVKEHKITHVICYKLDRVSRSQRDMLYFIEDILLPNHVSFVSLSETIDTGTPMGRLMIGILSAFAQLERENIRERTQMGMLARVESGLWPGGDRIPVGYDYDQEQGILIPNENAETIRSCFYLYLRGFSPQTIAVMTGLKYGTWVSQILARKTYIGIIVFRDKEYKGKHTPLIDEDTFYRVQKRLEERSVKRLSQSKSLLTGLMRCGHCGAALHYQSWGKGKKKIVCYSRQASKPHLIKDPHCPQKYYEPEEIEQTVLDDVFRFSLEIQSQNIDSSSDFNLNDLDRHLAAIDTKIKNLYGLYAKSPDDLLLEAINDLKKDRKQMESRLLRLQDENSRLSIHQEIKKTVENLENIWERLTIDEQRNILHILIESIEITDDNIDIHYRI
ncbi:MAG: recombinase family protein [Brotaphodocola sp.]